MLKPNFEEADGQGIRIILEKFGSQQHFSTRILLTVLILKEFVSYFVYFV